MKYNIFLMSATAVVSYDPDLANSQYLCGKQAVIESHNSLWVIDSSN